MKLFDLFLAAFAGFLAGVSAVVLPVEEPECPPDEIRPAVYQRDWPQAQYALDCEHALMTGRMLPKECA